jgi:hypothetical protein
LKYVFTFVLTAFLMVMTIGCQGSAGSKQPPATPPGSSQINPTDNQKQLPLNDNTLHAGQSAASLGGIRLGMTVEQLDSLLDQVSYTETFESEGGYFGESLRIRQYTRQYPHDCQIVLGQTSGKVLQIDVYSASYPTDLGVKVDDRCADALKRYRTQYKEWVGHQSDQPLVGWFETEAGVLVIFSCMENQDRINQNLQADSRITAITLGRVEYFD